MSSTNTELDMLSTTYNSHKVIIKLLPDFVNGSLNKGENTKIEIHLRNCFICKSELSRLQNVAIQKTFITNRPSILGTILKYKANNENIINKTAVINEPEALGFKIGNICSINSLPIPALAMASTIFISLLLPRLLFKSPDEISITQFKTLSNSEIASVQKNSVRVIFLDDSQKNDINNLLHSVNGRIINGPNEQGEYSIAINNELNSKNVADVLVTLKENSNVLFAEPSYTTLTSDNNCEC